MFKWNIVKTESSEQSVRHFDKYILYVYEAVFFIKKIVFLQIVFLFYNFFTCEAGFYYAK